MPIELIHTIYTYHYHRFREIWQSIMLLTEAQFVQEVPYSHGSLRNQMVHVIDDDASWLSLLMETARPAPLDLDDFTTRTAVRAQYDAIEATSLQFILAVDESFLQKEFVWRPSALPTPQHVTAGQALLHVVNHGTDHRAQILRILHDLGAPSFDQDLMGYLVKTGQTAASKTTQ